MLRPIVSFHPYILINLYLTNFFSLFSSSHSLPPSYALRATREPPHAPARKLSKEEELALPVQDRIHKSPRVWNMLCDLEESLGTLDSTKAVYYKMMDLKVCAPQTILNFASMLQDAKYFEEAFQVYERCVVCVFDLEGGFTDCVCFVLVVCMRCAGVKNAPQPAIIVFML